MDSRDLLTDTNEIRFILDTGSLAGSGHPGSAIEKLLHYFRHDDFTFIRSPGQLGSPKLDAVEPYRLTRFPEANELEIELASLETPIKAVYRPRRNQGIVERTDFSDPSPNQEEIELISEFDILTDYLFESDLDILVTDSSSILVNRHELEYEFCGYNNKRLHIMSSSEAAEFTGIYLRQNNEFEFYPPPHSDQLGTLRIGLTNWCWSLSTLLVPHFKGTEYLSSMKDRVESLCVGIDEIGAQHYRGTGNHTDIMVRYHFNNCISLLTGIGDVLALYTRDQLDVDRRDEETNLRTGGNPVLKALREENEEAWLHVQQNHCFIELLHIFRNDIIHQSGVIMRGPGHAISGNDMVSWNSHAIWLDNLSGEDRNDFEKYYTQLDDPVLPHEPMTDWGVITHNREPPNINTHTAIDAYQFIKRAVREMVEFVDEYLRLLGLPSRLNSLNSDSIPRRSTVESVAKKGLFPLLDDIDFQDNPVSEESQV